MATANYDELSHTAPMDWNSLDPLYRWEAHFPERMSRLHLQEDFPKSSGGAAARRNRRGRNRNCARFKTQPITFDEIKEVDEEVAPEEAKNMLKSQFTAFSRSMDGLMPRVPALPSESVTPDPDEAAKPEANAAAPDLAVFDSCASSEGRAKAEHSGAAGTPSGDILPVGLPQHDNSRVRRLRRRQRKSIEEEPELETEATGSQEAG